MLLLESPTNYGELRKGVSQATLVVSFGATLLAAYSSPLVKSLLSSYKVKVDLLSLSVPILFAIPSIAVTILFHAIQFHNVLSNWFDIREKFDVVRILLPLSKAVGVESEQNFVEALTENRQEAMRRTFYVYASFEEPVISLAAVRRAIDRWMWFWILANSCAIFAMTALILFGLRAWHGVLTAMIAALLMGVALRFLLGTCERAADVQIKEIVSDAARSEHLRGIFQGYKFRPQ